MSSPTTGRTVVANISMSLDGRITGPGGDHDMSWVVPHAVTDTARGLMTRMTETATTALLGRKNYEGFGGYWPTVAGDEDAEPRDRAYARWLGSVEKVVFSTTRTEPTWQNSRIVGDDPVTEVERLREQPGGDIVVLSSRSIIVALLAADAVDRLWINLCPEVAGGGTPLFGDATPRSSWALADLVSSGSGAVWLTYDRRRDA